MTKEQKKMDRETLLQFLQFRNRAHAVDAKKGKGMKYKRTRDGKIHLEEKEDE